MKILSVIGEGLGVAVRSKSLWLFGFFVGVGSSSGGGGGGQAAPAAGIPGGPEAGVVLPIVLIALVLVIAAIVMRLLSEGAFATLAPHEREIVSLRYGAELNAGEIAKLVGLEPANVRKILERTRGRLRGPIETAIGCKGEVG